MPQSVADPFAESDRLLAEWESMQGVGATPAPTLDPFAESDRLLAQWGAMETAAPVTPPHVTGMPLPRHTLDIALPPEPEQPYRFGFTEHVTVPGAPEAPAPTFTTGAPGPGLVTIPVEGAPRTTLPDIRGPIPAPPEVDYTAPGTRGVSSALSSVGSIAKGIGGAVEALPELGFFGARPGQTFAQNPVAGTARAIGQVASAGGGAVEEFYAPPERLRQDPFQHPELFQDPQWWASQVGQVAGSVAGLGAAAATGGAEAAALATISEAAAEAGGVYHELIEKGTAPDVAAQKAALVFAENVGVLGATNARLFHAAGGLLRRMFTGAITEGGQEGVQQILSNAATGRPLMEGVPQAVGIGTVAGTAFAGGAPTPPAAGGPAGPRPPAGLAPTGGGRRLTGPELEAVFAEADANVAAMGAPEPIVGAPAAEPPPPPPPGPPPPAAAPPEAPGPPPSAPPAVPPEPPPVVPPEPPPPEAPPGPPPPGPPPVVPPEPPPPAPLAPEAPPPAPTGAAPPVAPAATQPVAPAARTIEDFKRGDRVRYAGRDDATVLTTGPFGVRIKLDQPNPVLKQTHGYDDVDPRMLDLVIEAPSPVTPPVEPAKPAPPVAPVKKARGRKAKPPVEPVVEPEEPPPVPAVYLPQRPIEDIHREQARAVVSRASQGNFDLSGVDAPTLEAVLAHITAAPAGFPDLQAAVEERLAQMEEATGEGGEHFIPPPPEGAEAYVRSFAKGSAGPNILDEIARHGGIKGSDPDLQGEVDWMKEGVKFGRVGGVKGVVRKDGLSLAYMAEVLRDTYPEFFGDIQAGWQLIERIGHEVRQSGEGPGRLQYKKVQPPTFAEPIGPMFEEEAEPAKPSPPVAAKAVEPEAPAPAKLPSGMPMPAREDLPSPRDLQQRLSRARDALREEGAKMTPYRRKGLEDEIADIRAMYDAATGQQPPAAPTKVDILSTGEAQPRLPEAGEVRERDIATPTFEAPLTLTGEVVQGKQPAQTSMFGEPPPVPKAKPPVGAARPKPGQEALFERMETAPAAAAEPAKPSPPVGAPLKDTDVGGSATREPFYLPPRVGRPTAEGPPLKPSEIVAEIRQLFNVPVRTGRFREKAFGIYKSRRTGTEPIPQVIRLKVENDLATLAHELGHHIDMVLLRNVDQSLYRAELERLGLPTSGSSADLDTKLAEGVAEYWRLRFGDIDEAIAQAPIYHQAIEDALENQPVLKGVINAAYRRFTDYLAQGLTVRAKLRLDYTGEDAKEDTRGRLARLEVRWIDRYSDLRRMEDDLASGGRVDAVNSGYKLARLAQGYSDKATSFLRFGIADESGRLVSPASFEKALGLIKGGGPQQWENFGVYLAAKHALERNAAGKRSGMTNKEAQSAIDDYESDTFKEAAKIIYEWKDKLLDYAVAGDILSAGSARNFREAYQFHVPLYRVKKGAALGRAIGLQITPSSYKAARGGGGDIINPLESLIRMTHEVVRAVEQKKAVYALVRRALTSEGGGRYIEEIPPKMQKDVLRGSDILDMVERTKGKEYEVKLFNTVTEEEEDLAPTEKFERWKVSLFQNDARNYILAIQQQGQLRVFQMDKGIFEALNLKGPGSPEEVIRVYSTAANLLRRGATLSAGFLITNPLRDTWSAAFQSKYGFKLGYDTMQGLFTKLEQPDLYRLYMQSGAGQAAFRAQDRNELRKALRTLKREDLLDMAHSPVDLLRALNPLEGLEALSEMGEQATRFGEFGRALHAEGFDLKEAERLGANLDAARARYQEAEARLRQGISAAPSHGVEQALQALAAAETAFDTRRQVNARALAEAGMAARDITLDFQRAGTRMLPFNKVVAFLNANVQGYDRFARTMVQDPKGAFLRATLTVTLPSIALWALNHDDDEYKEIPEWEKQAYWHIPLHQAAALFDKFDPIRGAGGMVRPTAGGKAGWLKLPKPPGPLGMVFGTSFEKALDYSYSKDPDAWKRLFSDDLYADESIPVSAAKLAAWKLYTSIIPTAVLPIAEAVANYSTYRGRYLVSPFEEKHTPTAEQYTRWTSGTAKFLGRATNTAPVKWDHVIAGQFGTLGREFIQTVEGVGGVFKPGPAQPGRGVRGIPGLGRIYGEAATSSAQSLVEFYQLRDALDKMAGAGKEEPSTAGMTREQQAAAREARVATRLETSRLTHIGQFQIQDARQLLAIKKFVDKASDDIAEIRQQFDEVFAHPTMTGPEKRLALDRAYTDMLNIARVALNKRPMQRPWLNAPPPVAAAQGAR